MKRRLHSASNMLRLLPALRVFIAASIWVGAAPVALASDRVIASAQSTRTDNIDQEPTYSVIEEEPGHESSQVVDRIRSLFFDVVNRKRQRVKKIDRGAVRKRSGKKRKRGKKSGKKSGKKRSSSSSSSDDEDTLEPEEGDKATVEPAPPATSTPAPSPGNGAIPPPAPNPSPVPPPTGGGPPPTNKPVTSSPTSAPTPTPVQSEFTTELDLSALDAQYHSFFEDAASTWSGVITGDLMDYTLTADDKDFSSCGTPPDQVDDVYICAAAVEGDGPGGVLGSGVPESARFQGFSVFPVTGYIELDSADIDTLVADGRLGDFVKQQFGFIYGLGSLWEFNQLLGNDGCSYLADKQASIEFQTISGCTTEPVPIDPNTCQTWSEDCMQTELMTTVISEGVVNALSRITIASLQDLGYEVSYANADPFTASDLNPTCVCSEAALRNVLRERMKSRSSIFALRDRRKQQAPRLSLEGRAKAEAYGQKRLNANAAKRATLGNGSNSGSIYLGDKVIDVFYAEGGYVHVVKVLQENSNT